MLYYFFPPSSLINTQIFPGVGAAQFDKNHRVLFAEVNTLCSRLMGTCSRDTDTGKQTDRATGKVGHLPILKKTTVPEVLTYPEWCEMCVLPAVGGRIARRTMLVTNSPKTRWTEKTACGCSMHQCCGTTLIMNYQNDKLPMSPGAFGANALIVGWGMEEETETRDVTLKAHVYWFNDYCYCYYRSLTAPSLVFFACIWII